MCGEGVGIAVLPRPLATKNPRIRRLVLLEDPPHRVISMGYHRDLWRLQRLRAFVDAVVKHVAGASFDASHDGDRNIVGAPRTVGSREPPTAREPK